MHLKTDCFVPSLLVSNHSALILQLRLNSILSRSWMPYISPCPGQQSGFCLLGTLDPPYAPGLLGTRRWVCMVGSQQCSWRYCHHPQFTRGKTAFQARKLDLIPRVSASKPPWSSVSWAESIIPSGLQMTQRGSPRLSLGSSLHTPPRLKSWGPLEQGGGAHSLAVN